MVVCRGLVPKGIPLGKTVEGNKYYNYSQFVSMSYYAYILKSTVLGRYYYGHSSNPQQHIKSHD
jgi:hypothetical protein